MTKINIIHIGDELDQLNGFESVKALVEKILAWGKEEDVEISKLLLNLNSSEDLEELEEEELYFVNHSVPEFLFSPEVDCSGPGLLKEGDRWKLIELLLANGLDVNEVVSNNEQTMVHLAAYGGFLDILKSLVGSGANLHAKSEDGTNALHLAVVSGLPSKEQTIEWLIDQGLDSKTINDMGHSPELLLEMIGGRAWLARIEARDLAQKEALELSAITASVETHSAKGSSNIKKVPSSL